MRICVPIQVETNAAAKAMMGRAHALADIVEVRLDGIKDPDLQSLLQGRKGKILVTNRRSEEGGAYRGTEKERVRLLEEAVSLGADYVDLEASTNPTLIAGLKVCIASHGNQTALILSWHNFKDTPSDRILKNKLRDMMAMEADIIKIVTHARRIDDNLRVLSLIPFARRQGQAIIAFCMGPRGRFSRVLTTDLGAYLTFAALERGTESASGQLTVDQMQKIWKMMAS